MNYNPYQILDDILECYRDDGTGNYRMRLTFNEKKDKVCDKPSFQYKIFQGALDKLCKDDYLKIGLLSSASIYTLQEEIIDSYSLTFEGRSFLDKRLSFCDVIKAESNEVVIYPITEPAIHQSNSFGMFKWIIKHMFEVILMVIAAVFFYLLVGYWKETYDFVFGIKPY